jgi:hypothetical protein
MATKPGQGLAKRIHRFFVANPDEELTYTDVQVKFDCTRTAAHAAIKDLVRTDEVESVHVIRLPEKGRT